ncbi:MAG TPA: SMC-Scp complex subunit ScpB [Tepidisphaeraceae bacterium]|jgi:segregation and condensation protein B
MVMRVVWPDDETMPRKRKPTAPDTDQAIPEVADGPVETAEEQAQREAQAEVSIAAAENANEEIEEQEDETEGAKAVDLPLLEAMLFSTHHPLTGQRLGELLEIKSQKAIKKGVQDLNKQYEDGGRTFRIEQVAGGYQMLSLPEYGDILKKLHQREADAKLSKAALETLAIIAYKQPILRADVEAIRGVACGETIRSLMEKHLVNIAGRAEEPGRPILYGTTKRFLQLFGLNNLKDLPQSDALPKPRE